jgi:hypothetical protein
MKRIVMINSDPTLLPIDDTCPYLGFIDDDGTAMSYPSEGNICHKCYPVNTPNAQYQREYCLSQKHSNCSIFQKNQNQPMPKEIVFISTSNKKNLRQIIIATGLFVVLILVVLIFIIGKQSIRTNNHPIIMNTEVSLIIDKTPTKYLPTSSPTVKPSETRMAPTQTSTPIPLHILETPIGLEKKLVVHKIIEGETFIALANTYNTTIDSIKEINVYSGTLLANSIWIIPIGQSDISDYPKLKAIMIKEDGISLAEISVQYSIEQVLLSQVNDLPLDYSFHMNEWVIIPVKNEVPQ